MTCETSSTVSGLIRLVIIFIEITPAGFYVSILEPQLATGIFARFLPVTATCV